MSPRSPGWPPRSGFSWLRSKPSAGRSLSLLPAPSDDLHPTTIRISSCYIIFKIQNLLIMGTFFLCFFLLMLIISFSFFLFLPNPFSTTIAIWIGVKYYFMDTTTMSSPLPRPQDKREKETFCNALWIL